MIQSIFTFCVLLLCRLSEFLGVSYAGINVFLFCVLLPLVLFVVWIYTCRLKTSTRKLKAKMYRVLYSADNLSYSSTRPDETYQLLYMQAVREVVVLNRVVRRQARRIKHLRGLQAAQLAAASRLSNPSATTPGIGDDD